MNYKIVSNTTLAKSSILDVSLGCELAPNTGQHWKKIIIGTKCVNTLRVASWDH